METKEISFDLQRNHNKNSKSFLKKSFGDGIFYHNHESKEQNDFFQEQNHVDLNKVISKDLISKIENTSPCLSVSNRSSDDENSDDSSRRSKKIKKEEQEKKEKISLKNVDLNQSDRLNNKTYHINNSISLGLSHNTNSEYSKIIRNPPFYLNFYMNSTKNKYIDETTSINSTTTSGNTKIYNNLSNYSHSHGNGSGNTNYYHHYHSQNYLNPKQILMKNMNFNSNSFINHQSDGILTIKNNQIHSNPQVIHQFTSFSKGFMHGKNGWHCHSCHNFNFEWRSQCNKCFKYPIEVKNSLSSAQSSFFSLNDKESASFETKKMKKRLVERSGDWTCFKCKNVNFSFRKKCNRCSYKSDYQVEIDEISKANDFNQKV